MIMIFNIILVIFLVVLLVLLVRNKNLNLFLFIALVVNLITFNNYQKIINNWEIAILGVTFVAAFFMVVLMNKSKRKNFSLFAAVASSVILFVFVATGSFVPAKQPTTVYHPKLTITPVVNHTTWQMIESDHSNYRWISDGIVEIKNAKTDEEAAGAVDVWLDKVKRDPNLLIGATKYLLKIDVDKTTLVTSDGWATDKAVQLVTQLQLLLGSSRMTPSNAPANGYNSGVENNTVVGASKAGINGDVKSIKITLPDGSVVWIMWRCGNIVITVIPSVPPGKTDNVLTPKSSNPKDYKQPGDDSTKDSGTGTKPKVPVVTTPAESTPPTVITSQTGSSGVVDTPTNKPSSETGVTAPGATPPVSTTPVPSPEPGVNPAPSSGSDKNTGDQGSPFQ